MWTTKIRLYTRLKIKLLPLQDKLGTLDWGEIKKSLEKVAVFQNKKAP